MDQQARVEVQTFELDRIRDRRHMVPKFDRRIMSPDSFMKIRSSVGKAAPVGREPSTMTVGDGITRTLAAVLGGSKNGTRPEMPTSW
jgi:hypothetical protein